MQLNIFELTSIYLYITLAACAFYLAIMFFQKINRTRGSGVDLGPIFGLGFFVLFFGIVYVCWGYMHYFGYEYDFHPLPLYKTGILMTYFALIGVVFFSEKIIGKTKFAFTFFSIGCCVYGIFFTFTEFDLRLFTYITNPITVAFILISFLYFLKVKTTGEIRKQMFSAFLCYIGFLIFFLLDIEGIKALLPFPMEISSIISSIGVIITLVYLGTIFLRFETFTEFGWKDKLRELYIIAPNGTTLFHYSFIRDERNQDLDLISSGLTGVEGILGELIQSKKKLKIVDHQDIKIIFEYGEYTTIALITYENLRIYLPKLTSLRVKFEKLFQDVLKDWSGRIEVFRPANHLVNEFFG
ncbi:MAG: hypothetical protein EAX96_13560 [Candidatus Lokiarchaeota archaeon]|nr:hypothetical protein [Candidatus Lokiarchaeota archaeon]